MKKKTRDELVEYIMESLRPIIREEIDDALDSRDYELARLRRDNPRDAKTRPVRNEYGEIEFILRGDSVPVTGTLW